LPADNSSAASSALRIARPIPSPPIGSSAAAALPIGTSRAGQSRATANLGRGAASQSLTRVAFGESAIQSAFSRRSCSKNASKFPRHSATRAAGTLIATFQRASSIGASPT
jgi:hypothetical protein